jgi:hypothetical protein
MRHVVWFCEGLVGPCMPKPLSQIIPAPFLPLILQEGGQTPAANRPKEHFPSFPRPSLRPSASPVLALLPSCTVLSAPPSLRQPCHSRSIFPERCKGPTFPLLPSPFLPLPLSRALLHERGTSQHGVTPPFYTIWVPLTSLRPAPAFSDASLHLFGASMRIERPPPSILPTRSLPLHQFADSRCSTRRF